MELNEQVFLVIVFIKRHGGGCLGRIAMAFHLGQDDFCRFVPDGPARWLWLTLHSLFGLFGAALSAVVVLTLTGLLRRD